LGYSTRRKLDGVNAAEVVMAELSEGETRVLTEEETRALYREIHEAEKESLRRQVEMMRLGMRLARNTIIKWHDRKKRPTKDEMRELLAALSWPIVAADFVDAQPRSLTPLNDTIERLTEQLEALDH
jgi:hypothetical protein